MAPESTPVLHGAPEMLRRVGPDDVARKFPHLVGRSVALALATPDGKGGIAVTTDAFDSEVFERPIGRIIDARASADVGFTELFTALVGQAAADGFAQLIRRTAAADRPAAWALGASGFELMDVGITFARAVEGVKPAPARSDIVVRPATDDDITALANGMQQLGWGSRYESDPTYTPEQVCDLRTRWLWNSQRGRAEVVLVAEIEGVAAAFVTCVLDTAAREGDIELLGVLPAFRGRGAASHLVAHALAFFSPRADVVTVRTQATNFAAARVYERAGFTLRSSDLTFRHLLHGTAP